METYTYTEEYLKGLTKKDLLILMKEHGYEKGYTGYSKKELIEQLSSIVED